MWLIPDPCALLCDAPEEVWEEGDDIADEDPAQTTITQTRAFQRMLRNRPHRRPMALYRFTNGNVEIIDANVVRV